MIVADTNLLVYLYVEGQRTEQAEAALAKDPLWAAPLLWRSEFRNTVIGLVRKKALMLDDAMRMVDDAERAMAGREYSVLSHDVLQLAARSGCSAYDCEFVALAQNLEVAFVTSDRQVLRAFPAIAVSPDQFTA
ncbi:MAG: type II toxin-antitoxin system VapC family toxin [Nitrospira sp.]|nr:type II toxin-antitoxin system VapC family toxin [Nitrospira sp.]